MIIIIFTILKLTQFLFTPQSKKQTQTGSDNARVKNKGINLHGDYHPNNKVNYIIFM